MDLSGGGGGVRGGESEVDGGADKGVELAVGLAEWRVRVVGDSMFRVAELRLEALLPIGTTG